MRHGASLTPKTPGSGVPFRLASVRPPSSVLTDPACSIFRPSPVGGVGRSSHQAVRHHRGGNFPRREALRCARQRLVVVTITLSPKRASIVLKI